MTPAATHRRKGAARRALTAIGCALLCWTGLWLPARAWALEAAVPGPRMAPLDPKLPWLIEADRIRYDQARDEYVAEGDVVISKQGRSIAADVIRYQPQIAMAYAEGHIRMTAGTDVLSGSYLEIDLESEKGYLDDGVVFIQENNYHIQGDRIQKIGPDLYSIDRGVITTCDGPTPDWKISGRDVKIHDDGSGSAWNALIYARDVPLGYFPYISFPARNKRQTGFLFPEIGYSERKGASYNQPFYWVIDDQSDATFYLHYMSERGVKPGLEYRYYLNRDAKGAIQFDFFHDDKNDTGAGDSSQEWGYDDASGVVLRPNHDRYWFRMSHYNPLPWGLTSYLDLDLVSDQDYLRMFKKGYMGYEDSSLFFNRFFGRQLDDYDDPVRVNRLQLNKSWSNFFLGAGALLYDDTNKGANWKETTQRLPVLYGVAPKQKIWESPFFYNVNSEYDNFYRMRGFQIQRMDAWPRAYYPFGLPPYLTIEPSAGFRQTVWDQYKVDESQPWSEEQYFHREIYDTRLALSTQVYNIYDVERDSLKKIKHSVQPELAFTYVPDVEQDSLPNVDARDRLEKRTRISYALTNTATSKSLKTADVESAASEGENARETITAPGEYDYRDFLRFKVGQYYDFSRNVYNQPAREVHPFSTLDTKLTFSPAARISLDSEAKYNFYDDRFDLFNAGLTLTARKKDRLTLLYRYNLDTRDTLVDEYETGGFVEQEKTTEEKTVNSLIARLRLGVTERLALIGSYEYDFVYDQADAYAVGFIYESQCWTLEALFSLEEQDLGVGLRLRLHGIGEFGF
jgi:LPS-assembly protein